MDGTGHPRIVTVQIVYNALTLVEFVPHFRVNRTIYEYGEISESQYGPIPFKQYK